MSLAKVLELAWSRMACSRSATPFFKTLSVYSDEIEDVGGDDMNRNEKISSYCLNNKCRINLFMG